MNKYNGFPNWNHWNVSLWINNDENLYRIACECRKGNNLNVATEKFLDILKAHNIQETEDKAKFNKTSVKHALSFLDK